MWIEYVTLSVYLLVLMVVGALFSRLNRNISDFARGGAQGTWWMVGTSMFMAGISAFTFTGNASAAFSAGPTFLVIYLANVIGLCLCIWLGPWFRQTRATTWADVMRERFHVSVEQVSAYVALLIQPIGAATQLYALAIFASSILGLPTPWVIVVLGLIVLFYSTTGGRWAVMATDFVQGLILFALTILVFFLALHKVGGFGAFFGYFSDPRFADDFKWVKEPGQFADDKFTWKWMIMVFILQVQGYINLGTAGRFLSVKDSKHARWSSMLAAGLMFVGSIVWFLPPMVARFLYQDEVLAQAIKEPATASYAVIAQNLLPNGLMGLMLAAMFAATMSSMDSGLNGMTGVIVNNMIPLVREKLGLAAMSDRAGLLLCRIFTVVLGIYIIIVALMLALQKELSLFDAYLMISAVVGLPLSMPVLIALWLKRLHWWSYYIIVGASLIPAIYFVVQSSISNENWPIQDRLIWIYLFSIVGCLISLPLWRYASPKYREQIRVFYEKMHTPVDFAKEIGVSQDAAQYKILGSISVILGGGILLFMLMPNTLAARLQVLALGGVVVVVGLLLIGGARRSAIEEKAGNEQ
ncbi:MAG: sodium:solute symporter family protein [Puniceicoccales bacterium]